MTALEEQLGDGLTFLGTLDSVERQVEDTVDVMPMSWIFVSQCNRLLSQGQNSRTL